jgi:hypothetical protein
VCSKTFYEAALLNPPLPLPIAPYCVEAYQKAGGNEMKSAAPPPSTLPRSWLLRSGQYCEGGINSGSELQSMGDH